MSVWIGLLSSEFSGASRDLSLPRTLDHSGRGTRFQQKEGEKREAGRR